MAKCENCYYAGVCKDYPDTGVPPEIKCELIFAIFRLLEASSDSECVPAADVEPVKHGHWITDSVEFYKLLNAKGVPLEEQPYLTSDCVACSECMRVINCMDNCMEDALYCKYCGAKMDGENL